MLVKTSSLVHSYIVCSCPSLHPKNSIGQLECRETSIPSTRCCEVLYRFMYTTWLSLATATAFDKGFQYRSGQATCRGFRLAEAKESRPGRSCLEGQGFLTNMCFLGTMTTPFETTLGNSGRRPVSKLETRSINLAVHPSPFVSHLSSYPAPSRSAKFSTAEMRFTVLYIFFRTRSDVDGSSQRCRRACRRDLAQAHHESRKATSVRYQRSPI